MINGVLFNSGGLFKSTNVKSMENINRRISIEYLGDTLNAPPPGGANSTDMVPGEDPSMYEQNNELSGLDPSQQGLNGDMMGGDPGMMDDPSMMQPPEPVKPFKPTENPFRRENGKIELDNLLSNLYIAINDSIERIQSNGRVDNTVVVYLEQLADSVQKIKNSSFLQPIESTMFKYRLAVKDYELISKKIKQCLI